MRADLTMQEMKGASEEQGVSVLMANVIIIHWQLSLLIQFVKIFTIPKIVLANYKFRLCLQYLV